MLRSGAYRLGFVMVFLGRGRDDLPGQTGADGGARAGDRDGGAVGRAVRGYAGGAVLPSRTHPVTAFAVISHYGGGMVGLMLCSASGRVRGRWTFLPGSSRCCFWRSGSRLGHVFYYISMRGWG